MIEASRSSGLCCPACRGAFADGPGGASLVCPSCGAAYPIVDSIPILVPRPRPYLSRALVAAESSRGKVRASIAELERLAASPAQGFRRESLSRAREVLALNLALIERQVATLQACTTPAARALHRADSLGTRALNRLSRHAPPALRKLLGARRSIATGYDLEAALHFLQLDWSREPEAEQQLATVRAQVARGLGASVNGEGQALYLGAGLGRHAHDGAAHFRSVIALELSFVEAALLTDLRRAPLDFGWINWTGATSAADFVSRFRAQGPSDSAKVAYVIGDALSLPVEGGSQDVVVSIFFTDVVPLSKLMPEVKRVLKPGGRFVSVGPLHYHFEDKAERLTREELRWSLEHVHGLRVEPGDESFELPYMEGPGSLKSSFRCWRFTATK